MKFRGVKDLLDDTQSIVHFDRHDPRCHDVAYAHFNVRMFTNANGRTSPV